MTNKAKNYKQLEKVESQIETGLIIENYFGSKL